MFIGWRVLEVCDVTVHEMATSHTVAQWMPSNDKLKNNSLRC